MIFYVIISNITCFKHLNENYILYTCTYLLSKKFGYNIQEGIVLDVIEQYYISSIWYKIIINPFCNSIIIFHFTEKKENYFLWTFIYCMFLSCKDSIIKIVPSKSISHLSEDLTLKLWYTGIRINIRVFFYTWVDVAL